MSKDASLRQQSHASHVVLGEGALGFMVSGPSSGDHVLLHDDLQYSRSLTVA